MVKGKDTELEMIRSLMNQPGWDLLVEKTKLIKQNVDTRLQSVTKDGFDEAKGICKGVNMFYNLIVLSPREIINTKGLVQVKGS